MTGKARRYGGIVLGLLLAGGIGFGFYHFRHSRSVEVPEIDTFGLDPAVAKVIVESREKVRENTGSAQAWGDLGIVLFAHDLYPASLPCLQEAEKLAPTDARWPYLQALIHLFADPELALECLNRAIERAHGDMAPRIRRAETLMGLERWKEAQTEFEFVRERKPDNARAALGLGSLALKSGDWQRGVALLAPLLDDISCRRAARTALAEDAARRGDRAKATAHLASLEDLPKDVPWNDPYLDPISRRKVGLFQRLDQARLFLAQRRQAEAEHLLREILDDYPKEPEAHLTLGKLFLAQGAFVAAEAEAQACLKINAQDAAAHFLMGAALFQRGKIVECERAMRASIEIHPDNSLAHLILGQCREKQKDLPGAIDAYREAIRYRANYFQAHMALASALLAQGDSGNARRHAEAASLLEPENPETKRILEQLKAR